MFKTLLLFLVILTFVVDSTAQETTDYPSLNQLQRDVTFLLLTRNINDVTKELDSEGSTTLASMLRRLVIYGRAGQTSRVRKTLEHLPSVANWQCPASGDLKLLIRNADGINFDTRRFYHERICPDDIDGAEEFVRLWTARGNLKELDTWLAERSNRHDEWLMLRVQVRAKSGTAGEILDGLAAEIRANPSDWQRINRYLEANNRAGVLHDLSWLADAFEGRTAGDYFELAENLRHSSPQVAAKLLLKSLDLPFTDADAKLVDDRINRYRSSGQALKVNWEKQLRYWTKQRLADTYQQMNQSLAAQPLVEELVSMKSDDILRNDVHKLAGAVQSGSGHRVIETKIVQDETARRLTSEYWLERARYYEGREEYGLERDSYRQALIALAAKPQDTTAHQERFVVVSSFAFFLAQEHHPEDDKLELEKVLTRELRSVSPETHYAFQIAKLITQNELRMDSLAVSLLAKQPSFVARLLDARLEWSKTEKYFINEILERAEFSSELQEKIWSTLEPLARDPGSMRAYFLADAMQTAYVWRRAIPLWRGYIEHASPDNWEGYKSAAIRDLFTAYCQTKQWQAAEKLLFAQKDSLWRDLPIAFAQVAVVAAQQNAIDDAMRLWGTSTNLDRRNLEILPLLGQTKARTRLQAMYAQMKKDDPLSTIPDEALRLLQ